MLSYLTCLETKGQYGSVHDAEFLINLQQSLMQLFTKPKQRTLRVPKQQALSSPDTWRRLQLKGVMD